jgi:coenzyme F420 hydrogenase subunit beta
MPLARPGRRDNLDPRLGFLTSNVHPAVPLVRSGEQSLADGGRPSVARERTYEQYSNPNPHVINEIVDEGLCVRCGACEPACPFDIIRFDDSHYPYITNEKECRVNCVRCLKVCPGGTIDFNKLDDQMFGQRPNPQSITGIVKGSYITYSTNEEVRKRGASGGFVTQLLTYMLEHKLIDGALVLGTAVDDQKGWHEKPFIARTADELRSAAQSKYMITPMLRPLGEMEAIEGNYAVVALPCYVHALRQYMKVSPKLRKRLKLIIGLYCNVTLEPHLAEDMCTMKGVDPRDLTSLQFRSGEWPGGVQVSVRGGKPFKLLKHEEMKDEFNTLKLFYTPPRCNMCIDFSAEYADLAVGDPWLRGPDGKYLYPDGRTTVLTRTDAGVKVVQDAVDAGYIVIEPLPLETYMVNFEKSARYKRDLVPEYMELRRRLGKRSPEYGRDVAAGIGRRSIWKLRNGWRANFLHAISSYRWVRLTLIRLSQTPPALAYYRWNRKRKASRFAAGYEKSLAFVRKFGDQAVARGTPGATDND